MKNYADLRGCYPPRPLASVDNILLDLHNSSNPTLPHSTIVIPPLQCLFCIRRSSLIKGPCENYSKILGNGKEEQNHSIYSVSSLINKGLRIVSCVQCQIQRNDGLTMAAVQDSSSEDSDIELFFIILLISSPKA